MPTCLGTYHFPNQLMMVNICHAFNILAKIILGFDQFFDFSEVHFGKLSSVKLLKVLRHNESLWQLMDWMTMIIDLFLRLHN